MRARRILPILVLILLAGSQSIGAQEPAQAAARFELSFAKDSPLLPLRGNEQEMLPPGLATVTIKALDSDGELDQEFTGTIGISGVWRAG